MSDRVCTEIELDAPIDDVWRLVMNPQRLADWVTIHRSLGDDAPSELGEGDRFEQGLRLGGVPFDVTWTVEELRAPDFAAWQGSGPGGSSAEVHYVLEEADGGRTRFRYESAFSPPGGLLGKVAQKAAGDRIVRRESQKSLENLKRLIEADPA